MAINSEWIDNDEQLAIKCASWSQQPAIAIDTEFMRSDTFFPHIGLLQIADSNGAYLIDPLSIENKSLLVDVFKQPSVTKVIHSCSQDLNVFHHYLNTLPEPIFDTQVAAAFLGHGMSVSYANLLKALLGIDIPKEETRSDWLHRPLSDAQLTYAALDVVYLLPIYAQMQQTLQRQQRLTWVEAECQTLSAKIWQSFEPENYYTRVRAAWKLDRQQLAVLSTICDWREKQARRQDIPRNRIINDGFIWELAAKQPQSESELASIKKSCPQTIAKYGETLLMLIKGALEQDIDSYPELLDRPLSAAQNQIVKCLKAEVATIAEDNGLPPELLMRKKDYELLLHSGQNNADYQLRESLKNWRQPLLEAPLLELLASCEQT